MTLLTLLVNLAVELGRNHAPAHLSLEPSTATKEKLVNPIYKLNIKLNDVLEQATKRSWATCGVYIMKKTFVLLSVIQKRAKKLQKEKSLKWNQALDESAKEFGFYNFKNYKNISEANIEGYKSAIEILLKDISSENDKSKKKDIAISSIIRLKISFSDQLPILQLFQNLDHLDDSCNSYDSAAEDVCEKLKLSKDLRFPVYGVQPCLQFVCEKLNLMKDEIQAYFLNDVNTDEERWSLSDIYPEIINIDDFIATEASVNNLIYQIDEDELCVEGDYKVIFKFQGEQLILESEEDPHYDYFKNEYHKDRNMSGTFGVAIDRNKKITIVHSDMGIDNELAQSRGFTEEEVEDYSRRFPDERGQFDDMLVLDRGNYGKIKQSLSKGKPLKGKTLELAFSLVDIQGDDEQSRFIRNIGVKLKAGEQLDNYEHHILVDVLMLHDQLGA